MFHVNYSDVLWHAVFFTHARILYLQAFLTCLGNMGPVCPGSLGPCRAIHTHTCMHSQDQYRNPHFYKGLWHSHPHWSRSLCPCSQADTHKSMHFGDPCTCLHAGRGWSHTHRCPVHTACLEMTQNLVKPPTQSWWYWLLTNAHGVNSPP
jgi:hypothetical protein